MFVSCISQGPHFGGVSWDPVEMGPGKPQGGTPGDSIKGCLPDWGSLEGSTCGLLSRRVLQQRLGLLYCDRQFLPMSPSKWEYGRGILKDVG